jgi:hypothetical protein
MIMNSNRYRLWVVPLLVGVMKLAATEPDCNNLHLVTFIPEPLLSQPHNRTVYSFDQSANLLRQGKRALLDNASMLIQANQHIRLSCGIPTGHKETIYVTAPGLISSTDNHGYPERGAFEMYYLYKKGIIKNGIGISYCPANHRRSTFNFGGEGDKRILQQLLNAIANRNPEAPIVLFGVCSGATAIMNTLAENQLSEQAKKNIKAVVLESPALSAGRVWKDMGASYLPSWCSWLFPFFASRYFVNCRTTLSDSDILASYTNIPKHITFMISTLAHDPVTPSDSVKKITTTLSMTHSVRKFECFNAIQHASLVKDQDHQEHIRQFLRELKLDHLEGQNSLRNWYALTTQNSN